MPPAENGSPEYKLLIHRFKLHSWHALHQPCYEGNHLACRSRILRLFSDGSSPRPLPRALEGGGAPTEHPDYRTLFECTLLLLITSDSATSTSHHVIILIRTSLRRIYPPLFNQFSYHLRLDRDPQYTACTPVN